MPLIRNSVLVVGLLIAFVIGIAPCNARAEQRIALVLGNAVYQAGALKTTANDAGLVAQTLEAAGFDVIGARDLDLEALRRAFRDFIDKAAALGPDDVAFLYLGGYGLQLEGENYFVPIDARIERATDIPVQAVRLSDYTRALAGLKLKTSLLVFDLARAHPFAANEPLAGGLALVEPEQNMLIAFNAAPGTIAATAEGAYGPYAKALAEMMREGGLPLNDVFERVRLRVSDATQGAQVPWHASNVTAPFVFFERAADAPPSVAANEINPVLRSRPIRELGAEEAYIAALDRDTLPDYLEFLDSYANDPLAKRVRAIVAARREALIWRRTRWLDTPAAYWSYLRLYSNGPHVEDCYRRLAFLHASLEAPAEFSTVDYDISPPLPDESTYFQQPTIFLGDPAYDFPPPPPIPAAFLPLPSPDFIELSPPEPPQELFALPTPIYTPVPIWVRPPRFVQPPPENNVIFPNLHNKIALDRRARTFTVTDQGGHTRTLQAPHVVSNSEQRNFSGHGGARRLPAAAANVGPALPPSVAQLAATNGTRLDRAQREQRSPLPFPGAREGRPAGALGGSTAAIRQPPVQPTQPRSISPFWAERAQSPGNVRGTQRTQPLTRPQAPGVPGTATGTTRAQQGLGGGRPQAPAAGIASAPRSAQSSAQVGQPQIKPSVPPAGAGRPQGPAQATQALPKVGPPSAPQAAAIRRPQEVNRQPAQQGQDATARAQQQAAQQAAAARAQQQAGQQAAAARAQQQAAQQAAAARAQQQAAQQAAAARAQQQAGQQAATARAQQQAAGQAAAARAQQQAAGQAAAARAQQQAQQAAAARAAATARASPAIGAARAQHVPQRR